MKSGCLHARRHRFELGRWPSSGVPVTSGFAPLLNPMWQSLICTKEKSSTFLTVGPCAFIVCANNFEAWDAAHHRPQQPCSRPRHTSQKIPPVDAITYGLAAASWPLLHYFIFLEPIHIKLHLFLIAYTAQNWPASALFPTLRK